MATPPSIDFDRLLTPIAGEHPAGKDLRHDPSPVSDYQRLKLLVRTARDAEKRAREGAAIPSPDGSEAASADWKPILDLAAKNLAETTKDLELTTWLLEALVRLHGFAGLRDGFRLFREIAAKYWESVYPLPDEDGMETRVQGLAGLNGTDRPGPLVLAINMLPLTDPGSGEPYARWHFQQAAEISAIVDPEKRQRRLSSGAISMDEIRRRVAETAPATFADLREDLEDCLSELRKLTTVLDEKCGENRYGQPISPPSAFIRQALEQCLEIAAEYAPPPPAPAVAAGEDGAGDGALQEMSSGTANSNVSALEPPDRTSLASREDAFQTLRRVAGYFRQHEPQSVVPFLLDRAIEWGQMSLPKLMQQLIHDESLRHQVFDLVGIRDGNGSEST